ncbi:MAG: mevalonate kinase [Candidatus Sericytochromatia bacterium]|nr:mevalonate kinase [Candidatus Sericytochromatia bacterium]
MNAPVDASLRPTLGRACGKLILVGEHAVVHGHPALALPFHQVEVVAEAIPVPGPVQVTSERYDANLAGLRRTAEATLVACGRAPRGFSLHIRSTIPMGAGLGSSAATAVALVRALARACEHELPDAITTGLVNLAEREAHGQPSGLDAATILLERPIRFRREHEPVPIALGTRAHLVVADTGRQRDTRAAVAAVTDMLRHEPARAQACLAALGGLSSDAEAALAGGEVVALGQVLDRAHDLLSALGVSDLALDTWVGLARRAGALGAKLTGAGRGGCVLALAGDARMAGAIAAAWQEAGAAAVYQEELTG